MIIPELEIVRCFTWKQLRGYNWPIIIKKEKKVINIGPHRKIFSPSPLLRLRWADYGPDYEADVLFTRPRVTARPHLPTPMLITQKIW